MIRFLFAGFLVVLASGGTAFAGEDRPLEEEVRELMNQLGAEEFEVRENATRKLIAMGGKVGRVLLPYRHHKDPEIQLRIGLILETLGILTPEKEKAVHTLCKKIFEVPKGERIAVLEEAERLGEMAFAKMKQRLLVPKMDFKITCIPPTKWLFARNKAHGGWKVRIENRGKVPALLPSYSIRRGGGSHGSLVPYRLYRSTISIGGGFGFVSSLRWMGPISQARLLKPGGSFSLFASAVTLSSPGLWTVYYNVPLEGKMKWGASVLRYGAHDPGTTGGADRDLNSVRAECKIHVYPDWSASRGTRGVAMSIFPREETLVMGDRLQAEIRMENRGEEKVRIEEDWPRYTWVAFAAEDGSALVASTAFKLRAAPPPKENPPQKYVPLDLNPGQTVTCTIQLTVPEKKGNYFLSCGYNILPPEEKGEGEKKPASPARMNALAVKVKVLPRD
jgi:hypothetical protein